MTSTEKITFAVLDRYALPPRAEHLGQLASDFEVEAADPDTPAELRETLLARAQAFRSEQADELEQHAKWLKEECEGIDSWHPDAYPHANILMHAGPPRWLNYTLLVCLIAVGLWVIGLIFWPRP